MNSQNFQKRGILIWLVLCLLSSVLLYAEQIRRQFWDLDRDFALAFTEAGAVLTQNESVLPLLNGDEDLAALRKKFPQILDLQKTQGRALDAARVEPVGDTQYWLYNPWRQIRVLIDTRSVINARAHFTRLALDLGGDASPPRQTPSGTGSVSLRNIPNPLSCGPTPDLRGWTLPCCHFYCSGWGGAW